MRSNIGFDPARGRELRLLRPSARSCRTRPSSPSARWRRRAWGRCRPRRGCSAARSSRCRLGFTTALSSSTETERRFTVPGGMSELVTCRVDRVAVAASWSSGSSVVGVVPRRWPRCRWSPPTPSCPFVAAPRRPGSAFLGVVVAGSGRSCRRRPRVYLVDVERALAHVEVGGDGDGGVAGAERRGRPCPRSSSRSRRRTSGSARSATGAAELGVHARRVQHGAVRVGDGDVVGIHVRDARRDEVHDRVDRVAREGTAGGLHEHGRGGLVLGRADEHRLLRDRRASRSRRRRSRSTRSPCRARPAARAGSRCCA